MKLFLHTKTRIRIINGDLEWTGTPAEFAALEPDYPGLPILTHAPAAVRYQTPEQRYIEDSNGTRHADLHDALPYCDKIGQYAPGICIYVHVQMTATTLNVDDPQGQIGFTAQFRAGPDMTDPLLPVTAGWLIKLRHESGAMTDLFQIDFMGGECAYVYHHAPNNALGEWFLSESDFALVTVGGQAYRVKLAAPVRFAVYRLLS